MYKLGIVGIINKLPFVYKTILGLQSCFRKLDETKRKQSCGRIFFVIDDYPHPQAFLIVSIWNITLAQ